MKRAVSILVCVAVLIGVTAYCLATQPSYQQQVVSVPLVQQYIAVPVQPYYFSYAQQPAAVAPKAGGPSADSPAAYITRDEMLLAIRAMVQEIRAVEKLTDDNPGIDPKVVGILKSHCANCHNEASHSGKWASGSPVVFFEKNRLLPDRIDWNRVVVVTISGKMPKDGNKLAPDEINTLVNVAKTATVPQVRTPAPADY